MNKIFLFFLILLMICIGFFLFFQACKLTIGDKVKENQAAINFNDIGNTGKWEPDFANAGSVVITINNKIESKSLLPGNLPYINSFDIYGNGPQGSSFAVENIHNGTVAVNSLPYGAWKITANAKNTGNTVIGSGTSTVEVKASATSALSIDLASIPEIGTLNLSVLWIAADVYKPAVKAQLIAADNTVKELAFNIHQPGSAGYMGEIVSGQYNLVLKLLSNDLIVRGMAAVIRITPGQTTSGTFDFSLLKEAGGTIGVNITPQPENPLAVTITGIPAEVPAETTLAATALVAWDGAPGTIEWFLNGDFEGSGENLVLSGSAPGLNCLTVAAKSADGTRTGSGLQIFTVTGNSTPVQRITLMCNGNMINYDGTFDFDTIAVSDRANPVTFSIHNTGDLPVSLVTFPIAPVVIKSDPGIKNFKLDISSTRTTLQAPGSASNPETTRTAFTITYDPSRETDNQVKEAFIVINSNIPGQKEFRFRITCTAQSPVIEVACPAISPVMEAIKTANFDNLQSAAHYAPVEFTIHNRSLLSPLWLTGNPPVAIDLTATGMDSNAFTLDLSGIATVVQPGGSTAFKATLVSAVYDDKIKQAIVIIPSNAAGNNAYAVNLSGTDESVKLQVTGTTDFDSLPVIPAVANGIKREKYPVPFQIKNISKWRKLTISSLAIDKTNFTLGSTGAVIGREFSPGESRTFTISFTRITPYQGQNVQANLVIGNNSQNYRNPFTVSCTNVQQFNELYTGAVNNALMRWKITGEVSGTLRGGGGGGGGGGDASCGSNSDPYHPVYPYTGSNGGNGGNGRTAVLNTITVKRGDPYYITIGAGGSGGNSNDSDPDGSNGKSTIFRRNDSNDIIAGGGNGGGGGKNNSSTPGNNGAGGSTPASGNGRGGYGGAGGTLRYTTTGNPPYQTTSCSRTLGASGQHGIAGEITLTCIGFTE